MEEGKILDTSLLINGERGLTTVLNIVEFPKALPESKIIFPDERDFLLSIVLMGQLLKIGKPIQAIDIITAAMAINRNLVLATADKRMKVLLEVKPELKLEIR